MITSDGRCSRCLGALTTGGCPRCPSVTVPPGTITITIPLNAVWYDARSCAYCDLPEASHVGPNKQCPRLPSYRPKDF